MVSAVKKHEYNRRYYYKHTEDVLKRQRKYNNKPEVKEKARRRMLNGQASYMNQFITNPSKPQIKLFSIIKTIFFPILQGRKPIKYALLRHW